MLGHEGGAYNVRRFGAVGDGCALDTAALQQAVDACHEGGGGTVLVPAGTYLTGTLYLKSRVTLYLSAGATLLGSSRREDYNADGVFPENRVFTTENVTGAHLVIAYRKTLGAKVEKLKIYQAVKKSGLVRTWMKIRDLGGR